jgi:hypothetical protein
VGLLRACDPDGRYPLPVTIVGMTAEVVIGG